MIHRNIFCLVLLILGWVSCETNIELNGPCKVQYLNGICIPIKSCQFAMTILSINDVKTLKSIFCGFEDSTPKVCCPLITINQQTTSTINTTPKPVTTEQYVYKIDDNEVTLPPPQPTKDPFALPDRDVCGQVTGQDKIFGGTIANIDEFPWMARIKLYKPTTRKDFFACGGSLISDRYVLTAAHCTTVYKVLGVRLGEWDTETKIDCQDGYCNEGVLDVGVSEVKIHPNYDKRNLTADIALLRLENPVMFTDFIKPICLPTTEYIARQDYIDSTFTTAGWGKTEYGQPSVILRKVNIDSVAYPLCATTLPNLPKTEDPNVICAGGKNSRDTCQGDSGGPLFRIVRENYKQNWFLYGITSFGVTRCGTEGKPAVYTRVSKYMDWIREVISRG